MSWFHIEVVKLEENSINAKYRFSDDRGNCGVVCIDKINGNCRVIEEAANDEEGVLSERACWCLIKHWLKGEYPSVTSWIS